LIIYLNISRIVGPLLLSGVDINLRLSNEETVLYYTVTLKKIGVIKLFLEKNTVINTTSNSKIVLIITSKYLKATAT
jgi:ankyrin repeat protein